jgi:hypothetical protein
MTDRRPDVTPPPDDADSSEDRERDAWLRAAGRLRSEQSAAEPDPPPLSEAELDRLTAVVLDASNLPKSAPPSPQPARGTTVPFPLARWRRPAWRLGAIPLALAAGAAFLLWRPTPPATPVLPDYEALVLDGGARAMRSTTPDAGAPVVLERGTRFDLALRPRAAVAGGTGPGAIRGFVLRGPAVTVWRVPYQLDAGGALRITGRTGEELPHEPGPATLVVTLGPDAPQGEALARALGDGLSARGTGWRAYGFRVEMR